MPHENKDSSAPQRRYDVDWLRVIAIGILLVFHIMVMYQTYANQVRFIQSPVLLEVLLIPLSLSSVIRIPLLFFVSGMGVFFSLQRRNWIKLLGERSVRILVPLVFGSFAIVPIHDFIFTEYYSEQFSYGPNMGHLWFLANIYMYVLWSLALLYFAKEYEKSRFLDWLRGLLDRNPFSIYLLAIPYVLQSLTIPADVPYSLFFDSRVGLLLGLIAFLIGFTVVALGKEAWKAISRIKFYAAGLALVLYLIRLLVNDGHGPHILTSLESISWIFAALGLGHTYLNRPGKVLSYLGPAAYPIYIVHMIFLYLGAYYIFPLNLNPWVSLLLITLVTFAGCFLSYEILKRIPFLRLLFGMKFSRAEPRGSSAI